LSKIRNATGHGATWIPDAGVLEVSSTHALTRAAGYLKYLSKYNEFVLFRGQSQLYPSMRPVLHRGITTTSSLKNRDNIFSEYLKECRKADAFVTATPEHAQEGILQHYGIATKWLDLVDNIWVALWFACHTASSHEENKKYLHFSKRERPYPPPSHPDAREFAYIIAMRSGVVTSDESCPGLYTGREASVLDLRIAAPSMYLRPHAQHGVVMRKRSYNDYASSDMEPLVVGIIRIELGLALSWMGGGDLLSVHNLFPPPIYDHGYNVLLSKAPTPAKTALASICHICP
jgi:hypothetical protein